jgi:Domain of unknown function (DUF4145)
MSATKEKVNAPCSSCLKTTTHNVLHTVEKCDEDRIETFAMLQCAGCQSVPMGRQTLFTPDGEVEHSYYPSPISRQRPQWLLGLFLGFDFGPEAPVLGNLLTEVYAAVSGEQYCLAAMGIRAILEQTMIAKVGDDGSFDDKLNAFASKGFISFIQRDAMKHALELGHAAMHRGFQPDEGELSKALEIVENVLAAIYCHTPSAPEITKRVPLRKPRSRKS